MNFKPLGTKVLVQREEGESQIGSLIIPDAHQKKSAVVQVVAVGPDVEDVKVGDRVQVEDYSGQPVTFDGAEMFVVDVEKILGVFN